MKRSRSGKQAFVLPTLILITMVLLAIVVVLLAAGTTSLRVATHDQQSDQALYAAEAGLTRAAARFAEEAVDGEYTETLGTSGASYTVTVYKNEGSGVLPGPGGLEIPPGTAYFHVVGLSENGTRRETGALFTIGLQAFKVGALGHQVAVANSTFDAYNSTEELYDPANAENELPLLASNSNTGPTFDFVNSHIKGDVFVGPSGNPEAQITADAATTLGNKNILADEISLNEIEVPEFPEEDPEGEEDADWSVLSMGPVEVVEVTSDNKVRFDDGRGMSFVLDIDKIDPSQPDDCFASFGGDIVTGEDLVGGEWIESVTLKINNYHNLVLREDGAAYYTYDADGDGLGVEFIPSDSGTMLSSIIWGGELPGGGGPPAGGPQSVTNPPVLEPGFYDTVTINDDFDAMMSKDGTYVIKNLIIEEGSHLNFPEDGSNATFYITEGLSIRGQNAIGNYRRQPPKVKVFYTGDEAVDLAGGSESHYTLMAPNSDINLASAPGDPATEFFGALVGKNVTVTNANFHFDTATDGIGTGTMGSAITLIQRHRI